MKSVSSIRKAAPEFSIERGAAVFKALGHPSRLRIADKLADGERCVRQLAELTGASMPTVSGHLSILKAADVVEIDKRGQHIFYRLKNPCVIEAYRCLADLGCSAKKCK